MCFSTALQAAASRGSEKLTRLLLAAGAEINQGGYYGTPLYLAARSGHKQMVELLLYSGADYQVECGELGTALKGASDGHHYSVVELLLKVGADLGSIGETQLTAHLKEAVEVSNKKMVALLLNAGANPNVEAAGDGNGNVLHMAAGEGNEEIVKLLLNAKADVNFECDFRTYVRALDSVNSYEC